MMRSLSSRTRPAASSNAAASNVGTVGVGLRGHGGLLWDAWVCGCHRTGAAARRWCHEVFHQVSKECANSANDLGVADRHMSEAAVDAPHLPGDVRGGVRGEEVDDAGDLVGVGEPADRDLALDACRAPSRGCARPSRWRRSPGVTVLTVMPIESSVELARRAAAGSRPRGRASWSGRTGRTSTPRSSPGRSLPISPMTDDTIDDTARAALDHVGERGLREVERAGQVDRRAPCSSRRRSSSRTVLSMVMPALFTRMSSRPCCSMTSATARRQSSPMPMLPWCRVTADAVVQRAWRGSPSANALGLSSLLRVAGGDRGALAGQAARDRGADPAGAAGDERDAAAQLAAGRRAALPASVGDVDVLGTVRCSASWVGGCLRS